MGVGVAASGEPVGAGVVVAVAVPAEADGETVAAVPVGRAPESAVAVPPTVGVSGGVVVAGVPSGVGVSIAAVAVTVGES